MLGNPETLSLFQIVTLSASGMCIVFLCLGALILAIRLLSGLLAALSGRPRAAAQAEAAPAAQAQDEETAALLLSAVSEELRLPPDRFRIVQIRELP